MENVKIPKVKNIELKRKERFFQLALLTYEGGEDYIRYCLKKHPREKTNHYEYRLEKAFNLNLVSKIIQIFNSFVTKNINRTIELNNPELSDKYLEKIDYYQSLESFLAKKSAENLLTGNAFALADANRDDRAYFHDIDYRQIMDFGTDGKGYTFVDIWLGDWVYRYKPDVILKADIEEYNKDEPKFTKVADNALGIIPLVSFNTMLTPSKPYFGDAVYFNRSIFDHVNNVSVQYHETGFTILMTPPQGVDPITNKRKEIDPHTLRYIEQSSALSQPPQFIGPPTDHLVNYMSFIEKLIDWFMTSLNIYRERTDTAASGLAKSYDYSLMAGILASIASAQYNFEMNCWKMLANYDERIKANIDGIKLFYSMDFDIESLKDKLDEWNEVLTMSISELFDKYIQKKVVSSYVEDETERKAMFDEIDKNGTRRYVEPEKTKPNQEE